MKHFRKVFFNIKVLIVPPLLLVIWLLISVLTILFYRASITVLRHDYSTIATSSAAGLLTKGKIYKGEFKAYDNYLGSVGILIHNYQDEGVTEDTIVFRIKEKGANNWYYEHAYGGGQFRELYNFPFGFLPITDSKDKTYQYEIFSLHGNDTNALTISKGKPMLVTQYQYSRKQLLADRELAKHFLINKFIYGFSQVSLITILFVYMLFFGFYIFSSIAVLEAKERRFGQRLRAHYRKSIIQWKKHKSIEVLMQDISKIGFVDIFVLWSFVLDTFLIEDQNIFYFGVIFIITMIRMYIKHFSIQFIYALVFFLFLLCMGSLVMGNKMGAEKAAIWIFIFLVVAVIRSFFSKEYSE